MVRVAGSGKLEATLFEYDRHRTLGEDLNVWSGHPAVAEQVKLTLH